MNTKAKGSRNERKSMTLFEALGYNCIKSGASLGVFDVIAIGLNNIILCQVKTNAWPSETEMEAIRLFPAPSNSIKTVHKWIDGKSKPEIKVI